MSKSLSLSIAASGVALFAGLALPGDAAAADDAVANAVKDPGVYAVFDTSMGSVVCKLHHDKAPATVGNFVGLALGEKEWRDPKTSKQVTRPLYDGLIFHRCIKDFMIQGGCPLGTGMGNPGYAFADEFHPDLKHDGPGVLSMANSGPGTNGSQFFITHRATPWLDNKHSVFGKCVLGQEVLNAMADVPMTGPGSPKSQPVDDILLNSVKIVRTGEAAEAFDWKKAFDSLAEAEKKRAAEREAKNNELLQARAKDLGFDLSKVEKTAEGLRYVVTKAGSGKTPAKGETISAHYTGYLLNGTKFDSSVDRGQPFQTPIGVSRVIPGWDIAFQSMLEGEKRVLIIPPELAYGKRGAGGVIPPDATLIFVVELLEVVKK